MGTSKKRKGHSAKVASRKIKLEKPKRDYEKAVEAYKENERSRIVKAYAKQNEAAAKNVLSPRDELIASLSKNKASGMETLSESIMKT